VLPKLRKEIKELRLRRFAEAKLRRPKVYDFDEQCETVRVEYTADNGERLCAVFNRCGWITPPAELCADFDRRLNKPPVMILHSKAMARMRGQQRQEEQSSPPPEQS
jgi:hypothetical protein